MENASVVPGLVSIVTVCHNNWPDLEQAVESALHQSYQPLEVIVVDNDSSDATCVELAKRFGQRVRYLKQPNRGNSGGYNSGFAAASGEFIQFLDGDDLLVANKIEKQVDLLRKEPDVDLVYGDTRLFQSLPGRAFWEDRHSGDFDDMLRYFIRCGWMPHHSLLYRRRTLERVGPFDESLYIPDVDYWLRAASSGCRFRYCPGSLCFYRLHPGQMIENRRAMVAGWEAVWQKALGYVTSEPYRGWIAANLGAVRLHRAVSERSLSAREALHQLSLARSADPEGISAALSALAALLIVLPGGRALAGASWLAAIRHWVSGSLSAEKSRRDLYQEQLTKNS